MHVLFGLAAGWDVVLLEREEAARGASVRNFGLIWVSGRRGGEELRLALRSRALWDRVADEVPAVALRANGSLTVVETEAELRVLEQVLERADAVDRGLSLLEPDEARAANPALGGEFRAALRCSLDAAVEPRRVCAELVRHFERDSRFSLLTGRHAVELGEGWVRDQHGTRHEGDVVVACVGANHRSLGGWTPGDGRLRRVRLQMLETAPHRAPVTTSLADRYSLRYYPVFDVPARAELEPAPLLVETHSIQLLLQQRLDGSLTIGDTHAEAEPFDVAVEEGPYDFLLGRARALLGSPLPPVRRRWAGVYSQAPSDELFHVDEVAPRTVVVTGAGGRGMTLAPSIAESVLAAQGIGAASLVS
jgi:FAD dependent oxidoreductase TIGR03364